MDSQDTSQTESHLNILEQKDCQTDCNSNCEDNNIPVSTNGSIELHSSSDSQSVSNCGLESCIDFIESDNVNPVVTLVPESSSLQDVAGGQEGKELDLPSTVNTTASVTLGNCNEDNTDSHLAMDVSSSEVAVLGSGIPESSSKSSDVRITCLKTEKMDAYVDISHEVQQSDLGMSPDTEKLDCGGPQLQLHSACPQVDEPMNGINEGSSDNMKNSVDDCSVSQLPSECLETNKGQSSVTNDSGKIVSSIDDMSVPQPSSECLEINKEHSNVTNDNDDGKIKSNDISSVSVDNIKREPYDAEYERTDLIYRPGIIVDSDDDTDSSMFSNTEAAHSDNDPVSDEEPVEQTKAVRGPVPQRRVRTEGEVFPEELPPIEYLTISPGEDVVLEALGTVSGVVGVLVIVKADFNSPALFDDTVLFLDGRKPLGLIFETFGTVEKPYYSVRFNKKEDIEDSGIAVGDRVFFAPKADNLTKYVFIAELRKIKCDDASWENDNEPPPSHQEYSDDEAERKARQLHRNKNRVTDETSETPARRKKQRKKPNPRYERDPNGPQLLPGDLNRNPFGNKNQTFSSSTKPRWPLSEGNRQSPNHRPRFSPQVAPQPRPTSYGAFRNQWPPSGQFAERSGWNQQPGILGNIPNAASNIPNAAMTNSPNMGSFTNNMFGSHQYSQHRPGFGVASFPPPPPSHSTHGPNSYQPQNCMPPQANSSETYFPRGNMEHMNSFALPPPQLPPPPAARLPLPPPPFPAPQHLMHRPPGFPMFCPSQPPPVVNVMFNQHRPPTPHLPSRK